MKTTACLLLLIALSAFGAPLFMNNVPESPAQSEFGFYAGPNGIFQGNGAGLTNVVTRFAMKFTGAGAQLSATPSFLRVTNYDSTFTSTFTYNRIGGWVTNKVGAGVAELGYCIVFATATDDSWSGQIYVDGSAIPESNGIGLSRTDGSFSLAGHATVNLATNALIELRIQGPTTVPNTAELQAVSGEFYGNITRQ